MCAEKDKGSGVRVKNGYLADLNKMEFVVTYACTGRCKHCSEGEHSCRGARISAEYAADAVRRVAAEYNIETVMAFGGEPLLHPDAVFAIMRTAKECGTSRRQVITNGFFSADADRIGSVVDELYSCGVNDLLLSVDAFHQETIPLDAVKLFASLAVARGIPIRLQPAWLVSPEDKNPYNLRTREILGEFSDMGIPVGEGNIIFPEGNALKYLSEYFAENLTENPYVEDPEHIKCLSFDPDGAVLGDNFYERDIMEIINGYKP